MVSTVSRNNYPKTEYVSFCYESPELSDLVSAHLPALLKHALDLPMGPLDVQSLLLNHWHHWANTAAMRASRGPCHGRFLLLRNQSLKAGRLFCTLGSSHLSCLCSLAQAEIPILPCSICREGRQKEPAKVSLSLCQPCFGARPLWSVLSSVQPRHSPALRQALRSCWECIHPNPNSSGIDTLLVHTEHCFSNSPHRAMI